MKLSLLVLSCCFASFFEAKAQIEEKQKLTEINTKSKKLLEDKKKVTVEFDSLRNSLTINSKMDELSKLVNEKKVANDSLSRLLVALKEDALAFERVYLAENKALKKDSTDLWLKDVKSFNPEQITISPTKETSVFLYFDEAQITNKEILNQNSPAARLLRDVILKRGEKSYLGDITIPADGQKIYLQKPNCNKNCDLLAVKFKKLDIEIKEGYFYDIRAWVEDEDGNTHVFTNQVGISLLFYSQAGKRKIYLRYQYSVRKNMPADDKFSDYTLSKYVLKTTDVMSYSYKIGNRYIPHDLSIELPQKDVNNNLTNDESNAKYEIRQETNLEKVVELRAYTDFLGLFGVSDNGLAQIEGKAKFYLFPYPFRFFWCPKVFGQIEYFPSVSPHVNYSRFDNSARYAGISNDGGNYKITNELSLIEKRYLTMGLDVEMLKWQHKNAPVKISLYSVINYNVTEGNLTDDTAKNIQHIKGMGLGAGLHLSTKRFGNFGFDYKSEWTLYNYYSFNTISTLKFENKQIPVFKNDAEIFYNPNGNPNTSIFVRLITFNNMVKENNEAFYQFQFGYRFAIGNRTPGR